jgi:hypothetical protein
VLSIVKRLITVGTSALILVAMSIYKLDVNLFYAESKDPIHPASFLHDIVANEAGSSSLFSEEKSAPCLLSW